jgi:hypothetical protein
MVAKNVLTPAKIVIATLIIVQLIAMLVSGPVGARAPSPAVVAPNPALVPSSLRPVMVAKYVLVPAKVQVATLDIVPSIAMWVSGPVGARAPSPAVVAPNTALVISLLLPNMVVEHVLVPAKTQIATLAIAQLIALLVSGLVGPGAPSPAVVAPNTALVPLLLLPDMVAKHVLVPAKMQFATLAIVLSIAMLVNGPVGARAQSPVVVAPITALVPLSLPPVMVAKRVLIPAKMHLATLIIVPLIVPWVNGVTGARAP